MRGPGFAHLPPSVGQVAGTAAITSRYEDQLNTASRNISPVVSDLGIGILMLDTHFPRLPGDVGNARSWTIPVQFRIVRGASPKRVVEEGDPTLLQPFIDAAHELVDMGVKGITTSCGFLALFQKELQQALPVPVASSSLLQVPLVQSLLPGGKRVGILTISSESLTARHLTAVGVDANTPIEGLPKDCLFRRVYGGHGDAPDYDEMELDVVEAARRLLQRHPDIGAIVCECTNMAPHTGAIQRATGLPVYDIIGFIEWFGRSLHPPMFPRI